MWGGRGSGWWMDAKRTCCGQPPPGLLAVNHSDAAYTAEHGANGHCVTFAAVIRRYTATATAYLITVNTRSSAYRRDSAHRWSLCPLGSFRSSISVIIESLYDTCRRNLDHGRQWFNTLIPLSHSHQWCILFVAASAN